MTFYWSSIHICPITNFLKISFFLCCLAGILQIKLWVELYLSNGFPRSCILISSSRILSHLNAGSGHLGFLKRRSLASATRSVNLSSLMPIWDGVQMNVMDIPCVASLRHNSSLSSTSAPSIVLGFSIRWLPGQRVTCWQYNIIL